MEQPWVTGMFIKKKKKNVKEMMIQMESVSCGLAPQEMSCCYWFILCAVAILGHLRLDFLSSKISDLP